MKWVAPAREQPTRVAMTAVLKPTVIFRGEMLALIEMGNRSTVLALELNVDLARLKAGRGITARSTELSSRRGLRGAGFPASVGW